MHNFLIPSSSGLCVTTKSFLTFIWMLKMVFEMGFLEEVEPRAFTWGAMMQVVVDHLRYHISTNDPQQQRSFWQTWQQRSQHHEEDAHHKSGQSKREDMP